MRTTSRSSNNFVSYTSDTASHLPSSDTALEQIFVVVSNSISSTFSYPLSTPQIFFNPAISSGSESLRCSFRIFQICIVSSLVETSKFACLAREIEGASPVGYATLLYTPSSKVGTELDARGFTTFPASDCEIFPTALGDAHGLSVTHMSSPPDASTGAMVGFSRGGGLEEGRSIGEYGGHIARALTSCACIRLETE